jgi:hypothetical protein
MLVMPSVLKVLTFYVNCSFFGCRLSPYFHNFWKSYVCLIKTSLKILNCDIPKFVIFTLEVATLHTQWAVRLFPLCKFG